MALKLSRREIDRRSLEEAIRRADKISAGIETDSLAEIESLQNTDHFSAAVVKFCDSGLLGEILSGEEVHRQVFSFAPEDFTRSSEGVSDAT